MPTPRQTLTESDFLRRVREQVNARGLTLREAAELAGTSPSNLSRLFNEKIGLSARIADQLASSFLVEEVKVNSAIEIIRGLPEAELQLTLQFLQIMQRLRFVQ